MKLPSRKKEFLHSYYLLILTFTSIAILLFPLNPVGKVLIWGFMMTLYFKESLKIQDFFRLLGISIIFALLFIVLNLIYPAERLQNGEEINIFNVLIYKNVLENALLNFLRIMLLSHLSMVSGLVINYTKVILFLVQSKKMKAKIGYPLLIAINSVELFKSEYLRIKIALKFRGLSKWRQHFVIFPLLVFAIRHSQRGALSLVTRGLNEEKNYYYDYSTNSEDAKKLNCALVILFFLFILAIVF